MAISIDKDDASAPSTTPSSTPAAASTPTGGATGTSGTVTMIGETPNPPTLPREMTMEEQLFHAVLHSPLGLIEWLTSEVSDVDVRDPEGYTALHRAVLANRPQAVEVLLDNGADADAPLPDGTTLLHRAIAAGNAQTVELLLDNGADVDLLDAQGRSPALLAVLLDDAAALAVLINNSADLEVAGPEGMTPLYHAVLRGDKPCVKLLLDDGADADITDAQGVPLLHAAVRANRFIRKILLQASDEDVTDADGNSALHIAVLTGLPLDGVEKLLEYVSQDENAKGETPLFLAVLHRADLSVVKALIDDGADVDATDGTGLTPLHLAIAQGNEAVFRLLLDNGADVNLADAQGHSPLDLVLQRPLDGLRDRLEKALRDEGAGVIPVPMAPLADPAPMYARVPMESFQQAAMVRPAAPVKVRRTFWQWLWNMPASKRRIK